ncbi:hypothetical protein [Okeania sp.]|uniref:hypothetical protein n=1 Tax=Okeania sp. TaxID=3100323 RepID=UPI002B4B41CC|nr:hypothetical protein [Okeania sp.]MEB3342717.1 hypothetical protein [Okeania sp.]
MNNQTNDIFIQAHHGSVAAIILILNENLATLDVRIRAIFSDGVLQVLCEAPQVQQLEKSYLVEEVKQILETISPRNIQKVKINSRIVQEQQLLWLEDITRDPESQLLWSQQITLTKPNIFQQIANNFQRNKPKATKKTLSKNIYSRKTQNPNKFDVIGIFFMSMLMLTLGIQINRWFNFSGIDKITASENQVNQNLEDIEAKSKEAFNEAVRLAEKAVANGKTAESQEEWMAIAKTWEQAAELMTSVSPSYSRYDVAVNRAELYHRNSDTTRKKAEEVMNNY